MRALLPSENRLLRRVKIGTGVRSAVRALPDMPLGLDLEPEVDRLWFSIGVKADHGSVSPMHFTIKVLVEGQWTDVFSETLNDGANNWEDRVVTLAPRDMKAKRVLFEVTDSDADAGRITDAVWGAITFPRSASGKPPPNVILISLDTLAAGHLSALGNVPGVSPHLDEILKRSFFFTRAYAQYPSTFESHASLLTGSYPKNVRMRGPRITSNLLTDVLAKHGYFRAAITENAFVGSDFGFARGFESYDDGRSQFGKKVPGDAENTFEKAVAWLREFGAHGPFFLFVHTYEVHEPYVLKDAGARETARKVDADYEGRFAESFPGRTVTEAHNTGESLLSEEETRHLAALYAGEINFLDRVLGRFMEELATLSIAERTLLVFLSDHGEEFGEHGKLTHGQNLYNTALHVPLAFYWPGKINAGASATPVQILDVMPTALELTGLTKSWNVDGQSLAATILAGKEPIAPRPVFSELWKVRGECGEPDLQTDCGVERFSVQTSRFKLVRSRIPSFERLYDLVDDPGETKDVSGKFGEELERHRALLEAYVRSGAMKGADDAAQTGQIGEETRERLRALGYLE